MSQFNSFMGRGNISQRSPLDSRQVRNDAGGYVYKISDLDHLRRLLILGAPKVDYYTDPRELLMRGVDAMKRALNGNHIAALNIAEEVSGRGLGISNDPAIFMLAVALTVPQAAPVVREYVPSIVRTGTHVLHFAAFVDNLRGWGRAARRAVATYYENMPAERLAYQLLKYQQRDGWSHRDVIRLSHPRPDSELKSRLFAWAVGKADPDDAFEQIKAANALNDVKDPEAAAEIITKHRLTREMVPGPLLSHVEVWRALVPDMPLGALLRNLGNLTSKGVLEDAELVDIVMRKLSDPRAVRGARLHPLSVLVASHIYEQGHGLRGSLKWEPVASIADTLDHTFNLSFEASEPTGKSFLIGLDVSGSMGAALLDKHNDVYPLTVRDGAAVLGWTLWRRESNVDSVAFSDKLVPFEFKDGDSLSSIVRRMNWLPFGGTDCALPILYALERRKRYDVFITITDNETWYGNVHPNEALRRYRKAVNHDAKMMVLGLRSSGFSIADPDDPYQLDVVGFSPDITSVIDAFARM